MGARPAAESTSPGAPAGAPVSTRARLTTNGMSSAVVGGASLTNRTAGTAVSGFSVWRSTCLNSSTSPTRGAAAVWPATGAAATSGGGSARLWPGHDPVRTRLRGSQVPVWLRGSQVPVWLRDRSVPVRLRDTQAPVRLHRGRALALGPCLRGGWRGRRARTIRLAEHDGRETDGEYGRGDDQHRRGPGLARRDPLVGPGRLPLAAMPGRRGLELRDRPLQFARLAEFAIHSLTLSALRGPGCRASAQQGAPEDRSSPRTAGSLKKG